VLRCVDTPPDPDSPTFDVDRFADWTVRQLGAAVDEIRAFADHIDLTDLDGGASVHVTHGSRLGNRDGVSASVSDLDLPAKLGTPRDLFIGSHTHKPLLRQFNGTLVVNTGSVGQPMDNDPRAAYGPLHLQGGPLAGRDCARCVRQGAGGAGFRREWLSRRGRTVGAHHLSGTATVAHARRAVVTAVHERHQGGRDHGGGIDEAYLQAL